MKLNKYLEHECENNEILLENIKEGEYNYENDDNFDCN